MIWWLFPHAFDEGRRAGERAAAAGEWWWGVLAGVGLVTIGVLLVLALVWGAHQDD